MLKGSLTSLQPNCFSWRLGRHAALNRRTLGRSGLQRRSLLLAWMDLNTVGKGVTGSFRWLSAAQNADCSEQSKLLVRRIQHLAGMRISAGMQTSDGSFMCCPPPEQCHASSTCGNLQIELPDSCCSHHGGVSDLSEKPQFQGRPFARMLSLLE